MSKITFSDIQSTEDLTELNQNFTDIEQEFQNKVLYRDNPEGEPNHMEQDLDMNSNRILNLPAPLNNSEAARLVDVQNSLAGGAANLITTEQGETVQEALDERTIYVESVAELEALPLSDGTQAYLLSNGRTGTFRFNGSDLSAEVAADPRQGIYIAPSSDPTGASGASVRQYGQSVAIRPVVRPEWWGATGDGSTDETLAFQDAIDTGDVEVAGGHYMIDGARMGSVNNKYYGILVPSNRRITISNDAILETITATTSGSSIMFLDSTAEDVVIEGGVWIGDKFTHAADAEWGYGITIEAVKNVTVRDAKFKDFAGDGIFIRAGRTTTYSNNISVERCDFEDCRRHELTILSGSDIFVKDCTFIKTDATKDGVINATYGGLNIDIESSNPAEVINGVTVQNCGLVCPTNSAIRGDMLLSNSQSITVRDCYIQDSAGGIEFVRSSGVTVANNRFSGTQNATGETYAVRLFGCEQSRVSDNVVLDFQNGISVRDEVSAGDPSVDVIVEGNIINAVLGAPLIATNSEDIVFCDNFVRPDLSCTIGTFSADGCSKLNLRNNTLYGATNNDGIRITSSTDLDVYGNVLIDVVSENLYIQNCDSVSILQNLLKVIDATAASGSYAFRLRNLNRTVVMNNACINETANKAGSVILQQVESGDAPYVANNDFLNFASADYSGTVTSNNNRLVGGTIG